MFERAGVDIAWAKVTTLGSSVVDVFGLTVPASSSVDEVRTQLERELYAVLPAPPPPSRPKRPASRVPSCLVRAVQEASWQFG